MSHRVCMMTMKMTKATNKMKAKINCKMKTNPYLNANKRNKSS